MREAIFNNVFKPFDFYPFGMIMPGRSYNANSSYRFGFNGKEKDNEIEGLANWQDYGARMYSPRLGRFTSPDPISNQFPFYSTYQFAGNKPIIALDMDGMEEFFYTRYQLRTASGVTFTYMTNYLRVAQKNKADLTPKAIYLDRTTQFLSRDVVRSDLHLSIENRVGYEASIIKIPKKIQLEDDDLEYNKINSEWRKDGSSEKGFGTAVFGFQALPKVKPDDGTTKDKVKAIIESDPGMKETLDKLVTIMHADKAAIIYITGYASTTPTNINGTKSTTTVENNYELAALRTSAAVGYFKELYKQTYNEDLDPKRIITTEPSVAPKSSKSDNQGFRVSNVAPIQ